eukprot:COSAG05_NODE_666_length_8006_cov_12.857595_2_plen_723_part_00
MLRRLSSRVKSPKKMPTVGVYREDLFKAMGKSYTEEEFDQLCFEFGIELDEVTSEQRMVRKEKGQDVAALEESPEEVIYKLDIPANRYDLLCIEGVVRALRIFLGNEAVPVYKMVSAGEPLLMTVAPETAQIRPYVVCAVLRNVKFTQESYNSFIDLQDKLHENICRKRTLVAIGTHDLDTLTPPFTYEALPPKDIKFAPLNQTEAVDVPTMFDNFEKDANIKKFLHIIRHSPVYPVIKDAKGVVLSLPPIINGDHSKISIDTKNVFIECTATDVNKAGTVLNQVCAMFSQYCSDKFAVEPVKVVYPTVPTDGGQAFVKPEQLTPNMESYEMKCSVEYINSATGIPASLGKPMEGNKMCELLQKMQLPAKLEDGGKTIVCSVPPTRSDVLHPCDIMEDVAIAFGYDNIKKTIPNTVTIAKQYPINKITDLLRLEFASVGYTEVLTLALCSVQDNFTNLRRKNEPPIAVEIANAVTINFEICRTSLLPGLFKTVQSSGKHMALPLKLFEVSDIVTLDPTAEVDGTRTGSKNTRHAAAIVVDTTDGFEAIHGLVGRIMTLFGVAREDYEIKAGTDPCFMDGRACEVWMKGVSVGVFGVVHPEVLAAFNFDDKGAASVMELDVDKFLRLKPQPPDAPWTTGVAKANGESEGAVAGEANGYGTVAVDLAQEMRKVNEMKAKGLNPDGTPYIHLPGMDQPPPHGDEEKSRDGRVGGVQVAQTAGRPA